MKLAVVIILMVCAGCMTVNVTAPKGTVSVSAEKNISTSPSVQADGNTIPASVIP